MKICIVTHNILKGDGQGRVNCEVIQAALRQGHEVTIIASFVDVGLVQHHNVRWIDTRAHKIPTAFIRHLVFSIRSAAWLRKHRDEFDIVQVNGAITSERADVNAVHFVHSAWLKSPAHISKNKRNLYSLYQWLYTKINAYWEEKSFQLSSDLIAVSNQVRKELIEAGVPDNKIYVVVNGVDLEEFCPGVQSREQLELPINVPLAFFAGDIRSNRKNLDSVLQSLVSVPDLHLAVAGALEGSPFPQLAEQLGLNNRVHFLGFRSDISNIMKAVDLFVFPSRYEPFGLVVLEAMASGLPVITAITAGGAELVTDNCGFVLLDPNNVQDLSNKLNVLTQQPELRIQMGQGARRVAQDYSWGVMASKYMSIFEDVLKSKELMTATKRHRRG
jgi:glycosyltransferase involved in cell wall biosynthesis